MLFLGSAAILGAYLLGAIPFGLFIANARGVDLRHSGSGNIGATNVFRCVGKSWGIFTFILDMLKGFIATCLPVLAFNLWLDDTTVTPEQLLAWRFACGTAAFVGHCWPVYLCFKGGKGISTALGFLIGVAPVAAGVALLAWIVVFLIGRFVSLASIVAALVVLVSAWVEAEHPLWFRIVLSVLAFLAIVKHRKNIANLCSGTENRFSFTQKQRLAQAAKKGESNQ